MYKKSLFLCVISLFFLSCGDINTLSKLELVSAKTGFTDYRATIFYPKISIKVKNISDEDLTSSILVKALFIDKINNEQLGSDSYLIKGPFKSKMNKTVTLKSQEGITYLGRNLIKFLDDSNIVCEIYINEQFYKEIKIEAKAFM